MPTLNKEKTTNVNGIVSRASNYSPVARDAVGSKDSGTTYTK